MEHHGPGKGRRKAQYRDPLAGLIVITLAALVLLGVIAVRLRLVAVHVTLGARVTERAARTEPLAAPVKAPRSTSRKVAALAKPVLAPAAVEPAAALASAVSTSKKLAHCATAVAPVGNVDPTNGEISGTTGLPDQVSYFKARAKACASVARTATAPR